MSISLQWLFLLGSVGSTACKLQELWLTSSVCGFQALEHRLNKLWHMGLVACAISPDQGSNLCPLHWQVDSFTTESPGKPLHWFLPESVITVVANWWWLSNFTMPSTNTLVSWHSTIKCFIVTGLVNGFTQSAIMTYFDADCPDLASENSLKYCDFLTYFIHFLSTSLLSTSTECSSHILCFLCSAFYAISPRIPCSLDLGAGYSHCYKV